jgi:phosphatidylglycerophosphate synthase
MILLGILVLSLIRLEFSIRPIVLSKVATCFQFASVIAVLSKDYLQYSSEFYRYIFWATALFTISSGLHYMHQWFKMMGEGADNH